MKRHHAGIGRSRSAAPGDSFIGNLFGDLSIELFFYTTDIGPPTRHLVVELPDFENTIHESWKFFELGPLIISRSCGYIHLDRFFNNRHFALLGSRYEGVPLSGKSPADR